MKSRSRFFKSIVGKHTREVEKILHQSTKVCEHWTFLARTMGIKPTSIVDIKREMLFSGGLNFAIKKVLETWVDEAGSKASFGKLVQHLQREEMNQSAGERYTIKVK